MARDAIRSRAAAATGVLIATASVAVLAGCGGHDSAHSPASTDRAAAGHTAGSAHGTGAAAGSAAAADAVFVSGMIPHHEGAIDMAQLAKTRAQRPEVLAMADSIIASQQGEIDRMTKMKERLGSHSGHGSGHSAGAMSEHEMGMDGDMSALRDSKQFDRDFLEMMIPHHEGALRMSDRVIADGKDPEVRRLAESIRKSQADEIAQMKGWLKDWYGAG